MLARTSKLIHPSGAKISTPLLVPSFSSKGFKFDKEGNSEVKDIIAITSEWLTDTALVSAYDCYYKQVPDEFYSVVEFCFVDSGGI